MANKPEEAQRLFKRFAESNSNNDVVAAAQVEAEQLALTAGDTKQFRQAIAEKIRETRELQKLPPMSSINFDE